MDPDPRSETIDKRWDTRTLRVALAPKLGGRSNVDSDVASRIFELAREWSDYANVDIIPASWQDADIRIAFDPDGGYWSLIGTDCRKVANQTDATMNLAGHDELRGIKPRKVRHEFGHALGLYHEHQLTDSGDLLIPYDESRVLRFYERRCGWDESMIRHNVLNPVHKVGIWAQKNSPNGGMDQFSVMMYPLNVDLLADKSEGVHFIQSESAELSIEDRLHIMRLYP